MLGLGLLVRLGRQVLAGPVADSGVLPAGYYRHLTLAALEAEDFPGALRYLKWAADPLLAQIMVFRLRLLSARHRRQSEAIREVSASESSAERGGPGPGTPARLRGQGDGAPGRPAPGPTGLGPCKRPGPVRPTTTYR